jgi:hypothetical protein
MPRRSLHGEVKGLGTFQKGEFLPGHADSFVLRVRRATETVDDALKMSSQAHIRCIKNQVQILLDANGIGDFRSLIRDYAARREIEAERSAAHSALSSAMMDLKALKEELPVRHSLSAADRSAIAERLDLYQTKCQYDLEFLQKESSLDDVDDYVLQMLVDFHQSGPEFRWKDGESPMHWACQHGRHDLVEYLLSLEGGKKLLHSHDHSGRTPAYFAQLGKHRALQAWLRDEMGETAVHVHREDGGTSDFSHLPSTYRSVLEQIRMNGWRSMSWREDYTMLHWAASKGHKDVCSYLVSVDADPSAKDNHGRTPIDIAVTNGSKDVVSLLQNLRAQRRQSRAV